MVQGFVRDLGGVYYYLKLVGNLSRDICPG